ncbi:MAG: EscV/YscV/HrcV family type III secretion system export apparatus protein, partial [Nitrospirae bacterium]
ASEPDAPALKNGIPTKEPAFGLQAYWIEESQTEEARTKGYTVVDTSTVIVTHLTEILRKQGWEVLTRAEVQAILDTVSKAYPRLVEELVPNTLPLGTVQRVLQNLLKERVPIRDIVTILETLIDHGQSVKDPEALTEFVRQALSRVITKQYQLPDGTMAVLTLEPNFERQILEAIEQGTGINFELMQKMMRAFDRIMKDEKLQMVQPVLVCSPHLRRHIKRIAERVMPSLVVLSSAEIWPDVKLVSMGVVEP